MNELIHKLAEQARRYAYDYHQEMRQLGYFMDQKEYKRRFENKFAQLIVQECADYIRTNYDSWDAEPLAFNMEKDFGLHGDYA